MIHAGTQERVVGESPLVAGTTVKEGSINSDSLLATLWVTSCSGTLDVTVYTLTDEGKEVELFHFPQISSGTTNLLLKKSGVSLQRFRIQTTYSDACDYEIYIRAINGVGESSVRILGSPDWRASQVDIGTTPALLIAAALVDRQGVVVKNWSTTTNLYVGSSAGVSVGTGFPLAPRDNIALDVASGAAVYAVAEAGTVDVRIAESGG